MNHPPSKQQLAASAELTKEGLAAKQQQTPNQQTQSVLAVSSVPIVTSKQVLDGEAESPLPASPENDDKQDLDNDDNSVDGANSATD